MSKTSVVTASGRRRCRMCTKERYQEIKAVIGREYDLFRKHGITLAEFDIMNNSQEGKCKICLKPDVLLCVDYDHETEEIRGLLCKSCNLALGSFKDDIIRI